MKKNAKTVYILSAVAMMFVTVFATISFIYAWYITQTSAEISTITMSAAGVAGIQLSGDGIHWKDQLSTESTPSDILINQNLNIDSISTSAEVEDGQMLFYKAQYVENSFDTTLLTEQDLYYMFDFYVLNNDEMPKALKLAQTSTVEDTNNKDVAYCTRVAFIKLGDCESLTEISTIDGSGVNEVDYIWEPNSTVRNKRVGLYHQTYLQEGKTSYNGVNVAKSNLSLVNSLIIDEEQTPENEVLPVTTYDPIFAGDDNEITVLKENAITKIRVYIWVEGQDIDCTNSVSKGTAEINFSFNTYNMQQNLGGDYVADERFNAPTITKTNDLLFSWIATSTNLSPSTFSTDYIVRISKVVESQTIIIKTIFLNETHFDAGEISPMLTGGEYIVSVKAISTLFDDSDFSNSLTFNAFACPENVVITNNNISWNAVVSATSYTILAVDTELGTSFIAQVTTLNINLKTQIFDNESVLPQDKNYYVCVKANKTTQYASSGYSVKITWTND